MNSADALPLGILMFAFFIAGALIIPFINLLYKLKFQRVVQKTIDPLGQRAKIFDKFNQQKAGTPIGGGVLMVGLMGLLFALLWPLLRLVGINATSNYPDLKLEIFIIFFTLFSFGLLGLYDDIKKFFDVKKTKFFGLKMVHKLFLQIALATIISLLIYFGLGINFLNVPFLGTIQMGWLMLPFMIFVIVAFTNAVNITDGMDGLAGGLLMFALLGLWIISLQIMDTPMVIFIALWLGNLLAFLYFNVFPARLFMGDSGALAFGATLAVIGILLGKSIALAIIGLIFVVEIATSLIQLLSKKIRGKKVFSVSPMHLYLRNLGWEEPKIVQRLWLVQIVLTIFGVWITLI